MEDNDNYKEEQEEERIELSEEDQNTALSGFVDQGQYDELNDRYLRLYADFENYRKRMQRDREDLVKYANESILHDLLPAIDNLELALRHTSGEQNSGLVQGVEATLKELQRTLERFGLSRIEATGKLFDPAVHHAMSQVERADLDDRMIAEEFRAGYRYRDKVLRPALVSVSVKPKGSGSGITEDYNKPSTMDTEEEA